MENLAGLEKASSAFFGPRNLTAPDEVASYGFALQRLSSGTETGAMHDSTSVRQRKDQEVAGQTLREPASSPLLRLPPELRLKIFKHVFHSIFLECFNTPQLIVYDYPGETPRRPPVRSLFLVNRRLHGEAEEALWKNFAVVVSALHHYRYPIRPSPVLDLSAYAYSAMRELHFAIIPETRFRFEKITTDYNVVVGNMLSTNRSTWRFQELARRLDKLALVKFIILPTWESSCRCLEHGVIEAMVGIIGMFAADRIVVAVGDKRWKKDLIKECRYRTRDGGKGIEVQVQNDIWCRPDVRAITPQQPGKFIL